MATWQFSLHLIPRAKLLDVYSHVPPHISPQALEDIDWWEGQEGDQGLTAFLDSLLPRREFWSEDGLSWGDEDGNHVVLWFGGPRLDDVFIRIDVRELDDYFLEEIARLARQADCVLLSIQEMKIIEPDVEKLTREIERSDAAEFAEDPKSFFEKVIKRNRPH